MKHLLVIFLSSITFTLSAQSSCDEVKKENQTLKNNNNLLKSENDYLRNALKVLTPIQTATSCNVEFNLLSCMGDAKEQTVTILMTAVSKSPNDYFQFNNSKAIDVEGGTYSTYDVKFDGKDTRVMLYTDVPVKVIIRYTKVLPTVKILKIIDIEHYRPDTGRTANFQFKDINITWQ